MDSIVASRTKLAFPENGFLTSLNLTPMLFSFVHVICALSLSPYPRMAGLYISGKCNGVLENIVVENMKISILLFFLIRRCTLYMTFAQMISRLVLAAALGQEGNRHPAKFWLLIRSSMSEIADSLQHLAIRVKIHQFLINEVRSG